MSRKTRKLLPAKEELFLPSVVPNINKNIEYKNFKNKRYYDKQSKYGSFFEKGEDIWYKNNRKGWLKSIIASVHSTPRSYWIRLEKCTVLCRNSNVLRNRH